VKPSGIPEGFCFTLFGYPQLPHTIPYAINRQDDGLRIEWDQEGHEGFFPARDLRLACPCAGCVEEMSGRRLLDPASIPADIRPLSIGLVGAYGIRVQWGDGHSTGIYTFDRLLQACPCARCRGA
jgi:ATP-binding protein involved in chromosome partitioning